MDNSSPENPLPTPTTPVPSRPTPSRPPPTASKDISDLLDQMNSNQAALPREYPDEKCWTRCKQTNLRRAQGLEPRCRSLCYINMRNQLEPMLARARPSLIPTNEPGTFLFVPGVKREEVSEQPDSVMRCLTPPIPSNNEKVKEGTEVDPTPAYKWSWLDGRYLYYGAGRSVVMNHLQEMGGKDWTSIEKIAERCEAVAAKRDELAPRARAEQTRVRRVLGVDDEEDFEKLINLSDGYTNSLRRFHKHVLRIYSPAFKNLARLPSTFTDGVAPSEILTSTQGKMVGTIATKLSDGSALKLGERMIKSTCEVVTRLASGRGSSEGGGGIGGLGGGNGANPM